MKNRGLDGSWATLVVMFAGACLVIGSWVGSLYELPVRNMLSPEGIRWLLQSLLPNAEASPWLTLFVLIIGLGVLRESGLLQVFFQVRPFRRAKTGRLSPKRRQALFLAIVFEVFYVVALCVGTFSRYEILLGVTGTLERSPFLAGWPLLVAVGLILPGGIYGLASGKFRGLIDWFRSFSALFVPMAGFFVYVFCVSQLLAMFSYAGFDTWLGLRMDVLSPCFYYIPFVFYLFYSWREQEWSSLS